MHRLIRPLVIMGSLLALMANARAAEIQVVSSGGFAAAYKALAPVFEQQTGDTLTIGWGPSMGNTPNAVPMRLQRGEKPDVVIMVGYALGKLIDEGKVVAGSRVDLARSGIGVVVRHGAPHPDIGTEAALKAALLAVRSIAYSDSASGIYIANEMFNAMGIAAEVAGKARMIPAEPVGEVVARGEAEIGFQQISELKPIAGIDLLGPLPPGLQKYTVFSGGVVAGSAHPKEAAGLLRFLASPSSRAAVAATGLEPMQPASCCG